MSLASLLNDTARIYSISTSHDNLGGIVNTSSFVAAVPCRRWKRSLGAGEIAGQDNVRREYRVAFNPSTTVTEGDIIYIQGIKHDKPRTYRPGDMGLNHHMEVDVRQIDGRSS